MVAKTGQARAVTATYSGALTVGPATSFDGSRNGIGFSQLVPRVIRFRALVLGQDLVRLTPKG